MFSPNITKVELINFYNAPTSHGLQIPNNSKEWSFIVMDNCFPISPTSLDKLCSKSLLSSISFMDPHDWQKMWWWCWSLFLNSTTMVFSGVVNSDKREKFIRSFMTLYKVDWAICPSNNFVICSIVKGLFSFSSNPKTTNLTWLPNIWTYLSFSLHAQDRTSHTVSSKPFRYG